MASSSAASRPRARLITPWALAGLAALVALVLRALFPQANLLGLLVDAPRGDPLTVSYLANLHRLEPADPETALLLARTRLAQGRTAEALALASLHARSQDPVLRRSAMRIRLDVLREEASQQRPGAAAALAEAVRATIGESLSREELLALAGDAAAAGDAELEHRVYERIAAGVQDAEWLERTARAFLGRGEYRFSSRLFFLARRHAASESQARALYLEGVHALQSGNLPREALAAAEEQLGPLANDPQILLELSRLGLAAGRPDAAARYMKQLLWPRQKDAAWRTVLERIARALVAEARAADGADPMQGMRPFDPETYSLAYDVFLANSDPESAYRVARAAVSQVPGNAAWRERLARAAEWSRHPVEALAAWRWLAEHGGSEQAWQGVLRLAPGLGDDAALVEALRRQAERPGGTHEDARRLVDAWERLGRPQEALVWLEARARHAGDLAALALAADLADRMGRRDQAIALNLELVGKAEPSPERVVRLATLQVLAGRFAEAHALLKRFHARASPETREYWELLGDLAWMLQEDDSAIEAYRALTARREVEAGDLDRLVTLLRERQPEEAVRLAQYGYERFGTPGMLLQALEILWERKDLAALKRLYASLGPADEQRFAQVPFFFSLRAQYRQAAGDLPGARADLGRAMAIAPDNAELRTALLWLLIDSRDAPALRRALAAAGPGALEDRAAWSPHASAWMALNEPKRALPFLARLVRAAPQDYLWLAAYADALEQDGQTGPADRVRRQAWTVVRNAARRPDALKDRQLREAWARLAVERAPGDGALAVVRDLLRLDAAPREAPAERERSAATRELVLSWLISTEQHENAKAWLWLRYGRQLARPGWAEVSVALAEQDAETAARLLADRAGDLPYRDRIEAARLARQLQRAQSLAFESQESHPDDDVLHLQLAETLLEGAARAAGGASFARRGVVESRPRELAAQAWVTPRLRLAVEWREAAQRSLDPAVLAGVPARDRETRLTARRTLDDGWLEVGVGQRSGFADSASLRARGYVNVDRRLSLLATAARNDRTLDSSALAVAGLRDELSLRALYSLSRREYLSGFLWSGRYRSQNGIALGTAHGLDAEAGHRLRIEYPDVTLRINLARLSSRTEGTGDEATAVLNPAGVNPGPGFFVPAGSRRSGIGLSVGELARENWTRGWRPYGALDLTRNSLTGRGYNARFGVRGSAFGQDQLHLYWMRARGGGASGDTILEYGMRYEYFFDGP